MEVLKISLVIEYQLLRKTYILWKMKLMYCRKLNCYSRRGFRVCVVNWGLCRDSEVCVVSLGFVDTTLQPGKEMYVDKFCQQLTELVNIHFFPRLQCRVMRDSLLVSAQQVLPA